MSQDDLAKASGALKPMISKLENGSRELTRAWAERFAGPLRVSAIRIVFWDKVGPIEPDAVEGEFDLPTPRGWEASTSSATNKTATARSISATTQKPLRTSVVKVYVEKWRKFMGVKMEDGAKALDVTLAEYEKFEEYPFRLTAEQLARLAKAYGVHPNQFFFPVTSQHLTEAQKRLPAGIKLLKKRA